MAPRIPRRLARLLDGLPGAGVSGGEVEFVYGIEIDSREVRHGDIFVALRGEHTDGHLYVAQALAHGATAIVSEEPITGMDCGGAALVRVTDSKRALSRLSAAFYGNPSHKLDVIGVTGTNGKTTTTRMIGAILNEAGVPSGVIGTVGAEFREERAALANTTPPPHELQRLLFRMELEGARAVAIEVSSHALALERVEDVRFSVAALTNVTRDHLDFHESLEAYQAAKRRLFSLSRRCVLNLDDACGARWAAELQTEGRETIAYGVRPGSTLVPTTVQVDSEGSRFVVDGQQYELRLLGRFNVWNALAAIGVARFMGVADDVTARGLASLQQVPGRMERLHGIGIDVVVDYAHTPDALENALGSLRETTTGSLAVVFGCGGDRDRGKRAGMGAVAARLADRIYLTADNPRSEDPQAIVNDILGGIEEGVRTRVFEFADRRFAIQSAIDEAQAGDVVLVAGKGHETYQISGVNVLPFDDVAVAREALATKGRR
jgi:UDP-N-acetylmuramoyl-L-alanyl-D-glutamate--2,6-diaminopimelate ligase